MGDATDRVTTLMMLGALMRESAAPPQAKLELTSAGWRAWDGESHTPYMLTVAKAWAIAEVHRPGMGAEVLDQTRQMCGDLRIAAKRRGTSAAKRREIEQTVSEFRAGLAEMRAATPRTDRTGGSDA